MHHISKILPALFAWGILLPCALIAAPSGPATKPAATHPVTKANAEMEKLADELRSPDPAVVEQAMAQIIQRTRKNPLNAQIDYFNLWLPALLEAKHQDQAIALARDGVVASAAQTLSCSHMQQSRIKMLLSLGKNEEALANAKSLYNVCEMGDTADALKLIAECLEKAHPNDPKILQRFRDEQVAGAAMPAATQESANSSTAPASTAPAAVSSIMAGIKIDPSPYEQAAREMGNDYKSLTTRGNLLLLADEPKAAREFFERAYDIAPDRDLTAATESLARCIKAEDGTIGRANAFVLSLRPKEETISPATQPAEPVPSGSVPGLK